MIVNLRLGTSAPFFSVMEPIEGVKYFVAPGGTVSHYTWRDIADAPARVQENPALLAKQVVLTDAMLEGFADLCLDHGIEGVIWSTNPYDTDENQLEIIDWAIQKGVPITHVRIANEIYLRKFRDFDPTLYRPGALGQITLSDYADLVSRLAPQLKARDLQVGVMLSSDKFSRWEEWNVPILNLDKAHDIVDFFTYHSYDSDLKKMNIGFDDAIVEMQRRLQMLDVVPKPIFITESATAYVEDYSSGASIYFQAYRQIHRDYVESRNDGSMDGHHVAVATSAGATGDFHNSGLWNLNGKTPVADWLEYFLKGSKEEDENDEPVLVSISTTGNERRWMQRLIFSDGKSLQISSATHSKKVTDDDLGRPKSYLK